jgi:hypothetical protein
MDTTTIKGVKLTKEASDRGRRVLFVLQITCIVVFMAAWHEMPGGWTDARLRTAQASVWFLDCSAEQHPEFAQAKQFGTDLDKIRHDECHYLTAQTSASSVPSGSFSTCERTPQAPFCEAEIKDAKDFLANGMLTPAEARKHLESLHNSFIERTLNVLVPFLGISLDVNDLGLLGGITFSLLLTWLLFSLRREAENLQILFNKATDENLPTVYQLLEMTQVLTIPAQRKGNPTRLVAASQFILERLEFLLFLTPCAVQLFVVWNDKVTLPLGRVLSDQLALREFHWEEFLLVAMVVLTAFCFHKSRQANQHWNNAYQRLTLLDKAKLNAQKIADKH